jgi:hypothetical protein
VISIDVGTDAEEGENVVDVPNNPDNNDDDDDDDDEGEEDDDEEEEEDGEGDDDDDDDPIITIPLGPHTPESAEPTRSQILSSRPMAIAKDLACPGVGFASLLHGTSAALI